MLAVAVAGLFFVILIAAPPVLIPLLKSSSHWFGWTTYQPVPTSDELANADDAGVDNMDPPRSANIVRAVKIVASVLLFLGYLVPAILIAADDRDATSILATFTALLVTGLFICLVLTPLYIKISHYHAGQRRSLLSLSIFFTVSSVISALPLRDSSSVFLLLATSAVSEFLLALCCLYLGSSIPTQPTSRTPEADAGLFSILTFSWLDPIMALGQLRDLTRSDLPDLVTADRPVDIMSRHAAARRRHRRGLVATLWETNKAAMLLQYAYVAGSTCTFIAGPLLLNRLLDEMGKPGGGGDVGVEYACVLGMLACSLAGFALGGMTEYVGTKIGKRVEVVLSALVYRKALRRVPKLALKDSEGKAAGGASMGKLISLMSGDAGDVGIWVGSLHEPITTLTRVILCVFLLLRLVSYPALLGLLSLLLLTAISTPLSNNLNRRWGDLARATDARVDATSELLGGVRAVKLFAWEELFKTRIAKLRETEIMTYWWILVIMAFNRVVWSAAPMVTTLVTLGVYEAVGGGQLTPAVAFTTLSLFSLLEGPLHRLPETIGFLMDAWVSVKRIVDYLNEDELELFDGVDDDDVIMPSDGKDAEHVLGFKKASFEWESADLLTAALADEVGSARSVAGFTLRNLDVEFPAGMLTVVRILATDMRRVDADVLALPQIVGATGSGKSSLLQALLGEMKRTSGTLLRPTSSAPIAYVPQVAWLQNATIRDNIVFGEEWDAARYARVVAASALARDLEVLEGGDLTEIGEKGINLSGGQKQRISLARAAYSQSPYVLLDDCLSAVDAPTAKHLMHHCILGVLADRTRILVTNAAGLAIPHADQLLLMQSGEAVLQGPVERVLNDLAATPTDDAFIATVRELAPLILLERRAGPPPAPSQELATNFLTKVGEGSTLVQAEAIAKGDVHGSAYWLYFISAGGVPFLLTLLVVVGACHTAMILLDVVVGKWSNASRNATTTMAGLAVALNATEAGDDIIQTGRTAAFWMSAYAGLTVVYLALVVTRLLTGGCGKIVASRRIHADMLRGVLGAPLRFFEVTPVGRILNRFTRDVYTIDDTVGTRCIGWITQMVLMAFIIGTIALVVPGMLLVIPPVAYIYHRMGEYYVRASVPLKRLESVSRSPPLAHYSETLSGASVIRSFVAAPRFRSRFLVLKDDSIRAALAQSAASLWLALRIQSVGSAVTLAAGLLLVHGRVEAALAGLCFTLASQLTSAMTATVTSKSGIDNSMSCVERCKEYIDLEQEAPAVIPSNRPPPGWPARGAITIKDLSLRYAPGQPLILRGVSVDIPAGGRVAVVGRTGAGKSSLALAVLRIVEPCGGQVWIDGVDVSKLGLADLRQAVGIIPQDPVLFAGTVRSNLDPFGVASDVELWAALKRARLAGETDAVGEVRSVVSIKSAGEDDSTGEHRKAFSLTPDTAITESGSNLSAGQRQLLCLARSLVRGAKIVMLDEATASVDAETDARIQETIRTEFGGATVLTIAHRLRTVVDYERVIVLDQGEVIENGTPLELIEGSPIGAFRKMCVDSGEFEDLAAIARGKRTQLLGGTPTYDTFTDDSLTSAAALTAILADIQMLPACAAACNTLPPPIDAASLVTFCTALSGALGQIAVCGKKARTNADDFTHATAAVTAAAGTCAQLAGGEGPAPPPVLPQQDNTTVYYTNQACMERGEERRGNTEARERMNVRESNNQTNKQVNHIQWSIQPTANAGIATLRLVLGLVSFGAVTDLLTIVDELPFPNTLSYDWLAPGNITTGATTEYFSILRLVVPLCCWDYDHHDHATGHNISFGKPDRVGHHLCIELPNANDNIPLTAIVAYFVNRKRRGSAQDGPPVVSTPVIMQHRPNAHFTAPTSAFTMEPAPSPVYDKPLPKPGERASVDLRAPARGTSMLKAGMRSVPDVTDSTAGISIMTVSSMTAPPSYNAIASTLPTRPAAAANASPGAVVVEPTPPEE
ncbi:hypothetical protein HK101_000431 [Irineochytrium annulatum]|nr:hypothetical protein HK101_000431 [Irineochytrium annulatum]